MDATDSGEDVVVRQKGGYGLAGWYMTVKGMGICKGGGCQSGGHAEDLSLTGVVGG